MTEPAPFNSLYTRVKSLIPAAPDALIRQEITYIMMDFTGDTNLFMEEVPLDINTTDIEYPFVLQQGGRPNRLMRVWNTPDDDIDRKWADSGITMRVPNIIRLGRLQSEPKTWKAAIAKACGTPQMDNSTPPKPTGYPEVDAWIVDMYTDVLSYGVLWALQRLPSKPFRDPVAAKENGAMYDAFKAQARVNNQYANVYNAQSWRFPQGFATIARKGWT